MSKISNYDKDMIDGLDRPRLDKDVHSNDIVIPSQTSDGQVTDGEASDPSSVTNPLRDSLGERIVNPTDAQTLLNSVRKAMSDRADFDAVNNDDFIKPGTLSNTGLRLSDEEMETLIEAMEQSVIRVKAKAKRLKDAVIARQEVAPTVVEFDPNQNEILKKGMVKIFSHKDNTITFEHYQAALDARRKLSDMQMDKQLKNSEVLFNARSSR